MMNVTTQYSEGNDDLFNKWSWINWIIIYQKKKKIPECLCLIIYRN